MHPGIKTPDHTVASAKQGTRGAYKAGVTIGTIVTVATVMAMTLGEIDPYPLGGNQSWGWWLLRFPLVFAGVIAFVAAGMILARLMQPIGAQIHEAANGLMYFLFPGALVLVAFAGGTIMNLYNAAYGTPLTVAAQRWTTTIQPSGHKTPARTYVQYKVRTGPLKDEVFSVGWDGTVGHGNHGDRGQAAVLFLKTSWMGTSVVSVKE
ncbi:hypothetical protein [Cupriavidus necator]|uniref:hypothetical protein n=1 Tax=Cupriavidus necator TaxID=106590 RepID=UPI002784B521|nr:hypothetical protein [Cupriavidus necator]MDQ0138558.1 hypothetical protein [Cupriavidus necator]